MRDEAFKIGDIVRLKSGYDHQNKELDAVLKKGVIVSEFSLKPKKRDGKQPFRFEGYQDKDTKKTTWFNQYAFEKVEEVDTPSPWETITEEERKAFVRQIIGFLYRDKTAYNQINKLIKQ